MDLRISPAMRAAGVFVAHGLLWDEEHDDNTVFARGSLVGALQAEHLVATGHRRIGFLAPRAAHDQLFGRLRVEGAEAACLDLGIDRPQVQSADLTPDGIRGDEAPETPPMHPTVVIRQSA